MTEALEQKIKHAADVLRVAAELSQTYYNKPVIICYSGGKDSDVLLDIAMKTLQKNEFTVLNSHTTLDAPETVYHIRRKFDDLRAKGIACDIQYPTYKGERDSFYKLCIRKRQLPSRIYRFCCAYLKEVAAEKSVVCVGVREAESKNREGRGDFNVWDARADVKTAQHVKAMIAFDQKKNNPSTFECTIIRGAKDNKKIMTNPIYNFDDCDVWDYLNEFKVDVNPLYSKGYKRVGCIGCPMAGKQRYKQYADFPKYKLNMLRLCDKIVASSNNYKLDFKSGEDLFRWWLEEDYKQLRFEDLEKEGAL